MKTSVKPREIILEYNLVCNSCYGKETLHVFHQRDYKTQFKVKKAKVQ